jgi:bifunctional DNase/RNase
LDRRQVHILGISTNPASGGAYALLLREIDGKRRLPIIIGAFEAQAIALEIEGIRPPRPMTHDLLKNVIEILGYAVTEVTITELREGTFYARVSLDSPTNEEIDARPSDAIALAVRFTAPIYITDELLNEAGFIPEDDEEEDASLEPDTSALSKDKLLASLQKDLEDAIQKENYEKAAYIRDEIRKMQNSG